MILKRYFFLVFLPFLFAACNQNQDSNEEIEDTDTVEVTNTDTVEMIDAENSKHLAFKGVPIDGTLNLFIVRMEKSGFTLVDSQDGIAILKGDFAGYKQCEVYVSTLEGNDIVSYIVVKFPCQNTWEYLYGDYKNLKDLLTEKYGQPSSVKEEFHDRYLDDDQDRMFAVGFDKCKYETRFVNEKGEIALWIEHDSSLSAFVCLQYKDKINGATVKQQALNDL